MKWAGYVSLAYVADVHGFVLFVPYAATFMAAMLILKRTRFAGL